MGTPVGEEIIFLQSETNLKSFVERIIQQQDSHWSRQEKAPGKRQQQQQPEEEINSDRAEVDSDSDKPEIDSASEASEIGFQQENLPRIFSRLWSETKGEHMKRFQDDFQFPARSKQRGAVEEAIQATFKGNL